MLKNTRETFSPAVPQSLPGGDVNLELLLFRVDPSLYHLQFGLLTQYDNANRWGRVYELLSFLRRKALLNRVRCSRPGDLSAKKHEPASTTTKVYIASGCSSISNNKKESATRTYYLQGVPSIQRGRRHGEEEKHHFDPDVPG